MGSAFLQSFTVVMVLYRLVFFKIYLISVALY